MLQTFLSLKKIVPVNWHVIEIAIPRRKKNGSLPPTEEKTEVADLCHQRLPFRLTLALAGR